MKILLLKDDFKEINNLEKIFDISPSNINNELDHNKFLRNNKEWLAKIEDYNIINNFAKQATVVVYASKKSLSKECKEIIQKYPSKSYILRNKKELKIFHQAILEGKIIKYK